MQWTSSEMNQKFMVSKTNNATAKEEHVFVFPIHFTNIIQPQ
jgi:hypothetical protein